MRYLFDFLYLVAIACCSPWLLYQSLVHGKYRRGWAAKLAGLVPEFSSARPRIWLHAVSVGEVNLLEPLLRDLRSQFSDHDFVISTTTITGMELACKKYGPDSVFFAPLDFSWAVERAMRRVRPQMLVLAELEVWPNWVASARRHQCRVAVVNGRLSDRSFRGYNRWSWILRPTFANLDLVVAQTDEYAARFIRLGTNPAAVSVAGSIKFDHAVHDRQNDRTRRLASLAKIAPQARVFLAGSTQAPEEQLALESFQTVRKTFPELRLIIVPRHPERFAEVARILQISGLEWERRSQLEELDSDRCAAPILLVDTIGELRDWWGVADFAFVGGSLGKRGGQNMIEPAAFGAAVAFGPCTHNFRDIVERLLAADAARVVRNGDELRDWLHGCLSDLNASRSMGARARQLVESQRGATQMTVQRLLSLLRPVHSTAVPLKPAILGRVRRAPRVS